MTPDETATLQSIGSDWVSGFAAITNETAWLTAYAALVFQAGFLLVQKERRKYAVPIVLLFLFAVVLWTLDLVNFISEGKITLIQQPDEPIESKLNNALDFIFRIAAAQDALYAYMALVGDGIIVHRVWKLRAYQRIWIFFLLFSTLLLTYCVASVGEQIILGRFEKPAFCRNIQEVSYIMPLATTGVATILIGIMAWNHGRATRLLQSSYTDGSGRRKKHHAHSYTILILLVESGVFYFLFFLIQVLGIVPSVNNLIDSNATLSFLFKMFSYCTSVIVGMYPTLVIVLAHSKYAILDEATAVMSAGSFSSVTPSATRWPTFQVEVQTKRDDIELKDVGDGQKIRCTMFNSSSEFMAMQLNAEDRPVLLKAVAGIMNDQCHDWAAFHTPCEQSYNSAARSCDKQHLQVSRAIFFRPRDQSECQPNDDEGVSGSGASDASESAFERLVFDGEWGGIINAEAFTAVQRQRHVGPRISVRRDAELRRRRRFRRIVIVRIALQVEIAAGGFSESAHYCGGEIVAWANDDLIHVDWGSKGRSGDFLRREERKGTREGWHGAVPEGALGEVEGPGRFDTPLRLAGGSITCGEPFRFFSSLMSGFGCLVTTVSYDTYIDTGDLRRGGCAWGGMDWVSSVRTRELRDKDVEVWSIDAFCGEVRITSPAPPHSES
ncbi:hypothetical protein B0H12DRAFT_1070062 [Mycena haematopus]|nr:hypothetical protein B0H12DRAFT_1070062 [Mycena haematopus]